MKRYNCTDFYSRLERALWYNLGKKSCCNHLKKLLKVHAFIKRNPKMLIPWEIFFLEIPQFLNPQCPLSLAKEIFCEGVATWQKSSQTKTVIFSVTRGCRGGQLVSRYDKCPRGPGFESCHHQFFHKYLSFSTLKKNGKMSIRHHFSPCKSKVGHAVT